MAPEQLVMNISVTFEIPFGKVSLEAIEEAVRQSLKESGRLMIKTLLEALQKRLSFMLQALHPERFVKNGRHGRLRTFKTSFVSGAEAVGKGAPAVLLWPLFCGKNGIRSLFRKIRRDGSILWGAGQERKKLRFPDKNNLVRGSVPIFRSEK